jgi:hypothetical protein
MAWGRCLTDESGVNWKSHHYEDMLGEVYVCITATYFPFCTTKWMDEYLTSKNSIYSSC